MKKRSHVNDMSENENRNVRKVITGAEKEAANGIAERLSRAALTKFEFF
jgi:hypothetical protein